MALFSAATDDNYLGKAEEKNLVVSEIQTWKQPFF